MNAAMQTIENMQYARRRWLILATVAIAQLMIALDLTIVNVALPSAQRSLHFVTVGRQWVVTAYALAFGSLLLLGGRLADLLGRKVTFMAGLAGFAVVSAVGGASVNFAISSSAFLPFPARQEPRRGHPSPLSHFHPRWLRRRPRSYVLRPQKHYERMTSPGCESTMRAERRGQPGSGARPAPQQCTGCSFPM